MENSILSPFFLNPSLYFNRSRVKSLYIHSFKIIFLKLTRTLLTVCPTNKNVTLTSDTMFCWTRAARKLRTNLFLFSRKQLSSERCKTGGIFPISCWTSRRRYYSMETIMFEPENFVGWCLLYFQTIIYPIICYSYFITHLAHSSPATLPPTKYRNRKNVNYRRYQLFSKVNIGDINLNYRRHRMFWSWIIGDVNDHFNNHPIAFETQNIEICASYIRIIGVFFESLWQI
jgi:hypothetical protein